MKRKAELVAPSSLPTHQYPLMPILAHLTSGRNAEEILNTGRDYPSGYPQILTRASNIWPRTRLGSINKIRTTSNSLS